VEESSESFEVRKISRDFFEKKISAKFYLLKVEESGVAQFVVESVKSVHSCWPRKTNSSTTDFSQAEAFHM
jgi:hypothetical protein